MFNVLFVIHGKYLDGLVCGQSSGLGLWNCKYDTTLRLVNRPSNLQSVWQFRRFHWDFSFNHNEVDMPQRVSSVKEPSLYIIYLGYLTTIRLTGRLSQLCAAIVTDLDVVNNCSELVDLKISDATSTTLVGFGAMAAQCARG